MPIPYDQLVPMWQTTFRSEFEELLLQGTFTAYHRAHQVCVEEQLDPFERVSARAHFRRSLMEKVIRESAAQTGIQSVTQANHTGTHNYRLLRSGIIEVTQSHVVDRFKMPQHADFRHSLAVSAQMTLCFSSDDLQDDPDGKVYALIVHREVHGKPWLPEFVDVIFPTRSREHAGVRLRMFDIHADLVQSILDYQTTSFPVENVEQPPNPELLNNQLPHTGTDSQ